MLGGQDLEQFCDRLERGEARHSGSNVHERYSSMCRIFNVVLLWRSYDLDEYKLLIIMLGAAELLKTEVDY